MVSTCSGVKSCNTGNQIWTAFSVTVGSVLVVEDARNPLALDLRLRIVEFLTDVLPSGLGHVLDFHYSGLTREYQSSELKIRVHVGIHFDTWSNTRHTP